METVTGFNINLWIELHQMIDSKKHLLCLTQAKGLFNHWFVTGVWKAHVRTEMFYYAVQLQVLSPASLFINPCIVHNIISLDDAQQVWCSVSTGKKGSSGIITLLCSDLYQGCE